MDRRLLREEQIRPVKRQISVHLVGRYLVITGNAVLPACIHQDCGSFDIGIQEHLGILDRTVHMALCRKINHYIRVLFLKQSVYRFAVRYTLLHESEIRIVHHRFQRGHIARVSQAVQTDDAVIRILVKHVKYKVASDKSGSAGHYNIHTDTSLINLF